jgi:hypothetical protein
MNELNTIQNKNQKCQTNSRYDYFRQNEGNSSEPVKISNLYFEITFKFIFLTYRGTEAYNCNTI